MSLDVMKQALEALEEIADEVFSPYDNKLGDAILALRAAIEQAHDWDEVEALRESLREHMAEIQRLRAAIEQAQEPVAWVGPSWLNPETRTWESESFAPGPIKGWIPLYTAPRREWQGLTGEEVAELTLEHVGYPVRLTGAIEAKLKEKNNG